jgi:hypothetical protein
MPASNIQRVQKRRAAMRDAGLRPVQIWVPDTRRTGFAHSCAQQSALTAASDQSDRDLIDFMDQALAESENWTA